MPEQVSNVSITDNGDGTCDVQIGPNGYDGLSIQSSFFDRNTFNQDQLCGNIRLTRVIGNYGALGSEELITRLNAQGIHLSDADYSGIGLVDNGDGTATVSYQNQTLTVPTAQLSGDTGDQQMVLDNIASFVRLAGFTDLATPATSGPYKGQTAVQAVAGWTFWY